MGRIQRIIVISIFALALITRIFWIDRAMPGMNWDEVAHGYNSYSLMTTAKDEFGNFLPLSLRSFDDYKPALYAYFTIPFIKVLGLNVYAVRSVSVISGLLVVLSSALLSYLFFKNKKAAIITSILVSIEPWGILFSRAAYEANLALALLLFGIYFSIKDKTRGFGGYVGIFLLALSMYAYQINKLLAPIIAFTLIYYFSKGKNTKKILKPLLLFLVFTTPLVVGLLLNEGSASRFTATSIFGKYKPWELLLQIPARYFSYFSPVNLFVRGSPEPTQQIPGFGMFYVWEFLFWAIGLIKILEKPKANKLFILLLMLSAIPAAITWNWFYPARALTTFAFFSITIAIGIAKTTRHWFLNCIVTIFAILVFGRFMVTLLFNVPYKDGGAWQSGMAEVMKTVDTYGQDYENIVIETGNAQPYIFALFYTKYSPEKYHEEIVKMGGIPKPRKSFDFGKYTFRPVLWREDKNSKNTLLVSPVSSLSEDKVDKDDVRLYKIIYNQFGDEIGRVVGTEK
jgi:4-amino-4-deoxy-L-arabinose transferase-like glycosyltransferase